MKKVIVFAVLLIGFLCGWAMGTNYYCDPVSGSNDNNGLSTSTAWADLQSAEEAGKIDALDDSGDTVYLMNGYHGLPLIGIVNDVTFEAYSGHSPTVERFRLWGSPNITIRGLDISPDNNTPSSVKGDKTWSNSPAIISIESGSNGTLIDNCTIYTTDFATAGDWNDAEWQNNMYRGVYENSSSGMSVTDCDISYVGYAIVSVTVDSTRSISGNLINYFACDAIRCGGDNLTISDNIIINSVDCDSGGTHRDAVQWHDDTENSNNTVTGNYISAYTPDYALNAAFKYPLQGLFYSDPCWIKDTTISNNIIITSSLHGISFYDCQNCDIINNTVIKTPNHAGDLYPRIRSPVGNSNAYVVNNIAIIADYTNGDSNIVTNNYNPTSYDLNDQFVDYDNHDCNLVSGSDFVDVGTDVNSPATDINGETRDASPDVGACEYVVGAPETVTYFIARLFSCLSIY